MIKLPMILEYDPKPLRGETRQEPWWLIAFSQCDVSEYYAWFLRKRTGLVLQKPAWGAHVSIVRGEEPVNMDAWGKYQGQTIEIEMEVDIKTNGKHWWLRVVSEEVRDLREELGLFRYGKPIDGGHIGLHLTIGSPIQRHMEISNYYHTVFTKYY